ncbi:MAG: DUF1887 family CARF protein [Pseudomonadota bacterium]
MKTNNSATPSTHVCLISEQPIPNLVPLLLEKPAKAVFLVSPQMEAQADRLQKIIQPAGITVKRQSIASAYNFRAVQQACEEVIQRAENEAPLTLNVTGGTKIAALAAFQAFYFNNHRIIYLDTEGNKLLQLAPGPEETALVGNIIRFRDYLAAYGMTPLSWNDTVQSSQRPGLHELAELLIGDEQLLSSLNSAIDRNGNNPSYLNLSLNDLGAKAEKLAACLMECGVASPAQSGILNISSREKIFFCNGGWLEEYVYWVVKSLGIKGLDLAMNVKVQWDGQGRRQTENEFDILFTHENRLHMLSCKAANPSRKTSTGTKAVEALNELDTLSDRAGGLFGRPLLVSARRLADFDRERAKKMKIGLIDGADVLALKKNIRRWLGL